LLKSEAASSDLASFAPSVAFDARASSASSCFWVGGLSDHSSLARGSDGGIDVEEDVAMALTVNESASLFAGKSVVQEVLEEELSGGLKGVVVDIG
jgi:hypothetical protein